MSKSPFANAPSVTFAMFAHARPPRRSATP